MDLILKHNYWTFDLSPYIFLVKDIPFQWVTSLWGIPLLLLFFVGGWFGNRLFVVNAFCREVIESVLVYLLLIFLTLFGFQKFHISWGLRWYSTMYLIGFLTLYFSSLYWIKKGKLQLNENQLVTLIAYLIIGMLLGARCAYVFIYNWDYYHSHPWEALATWAGGLSFHGAVIGILIALVVFCRRYKLSFFHIADKICFIAPVGIGFGRIGNFFNGELWGRPIESHIPWAVVFPQAGAVPRHPSQIYQSLGEGWLLFLTLFLLSRLGIVRKKDGVISAFFIIFYCLYRFVMEYFREADIQVNYLFLNHMAWAPLGSFPSTLWWQIVTMGQLLCAIFFLIGLGLLVWLAKRNFSKESLF